MGPAMKSKANVKIRFVNQRIADRKLFKEPLNVDEWRITVPLITMHLA
jgi:hypothetical protein